MERRSFSADRMAPVGKEESADEGKAPPASVGEEAGENVTAAVVEFHVGVESDGDSNRAVTEFFAEPAVLPIVKFMTPALFSRTKFVFRFF